MAGMLYLVPTPIGNLGDISVRCRKTLAEADFIAAEDTRVTLKLLNYLELKKPLRELLRTQQGRERPAHRGAHPRGRRRCVLVSDAGSPAISDPGEDLVRLCAEAGIAVCADSRAVRGHHGAFHLRAADGALLLRGLPLDQ